MTKKLLFSLMLFVLICLRVTNAQICQPDPQYTIPGIYPDSATGMPCAIVDSLYNEVITAVIPVDTTAEFPAGSGTFVDFWVDSIVLISPYITGLPPGIVVGGGCNTSSCGSPPPGFPGGTSGCVKVIGTTTLAGVYPIEFYTRSYVRFKSTGFAVYQDDTTSYYFINVVAAALILDTTSVTNTTTCGATDGAIDLSVTGGTGSYIYSWSPGGATTQDINSLSPGIYTVTVTDDCFTRMLSVTVSGAGALSVSVDSVTNVSTFGGNDGVIYVSVSGGTTPYTYYWNTDSMITNNTTDTIDSLISGIYNLTVIDAAGNEGCISAQITQPSGISENNMSDFDVVRNIPNPFTDKTEIIFTSPKAANIEFKVYNVLGKIVYSENVKAKAGINTLEFFTNDLPAGIYLYGLSNDKHRVVRKMVIND